MNRLWALILCALINLPLSFTNPAQAALFHWPASSPFGLSPFWQWKQIETEHFWITYPQELEQIAQRAASLYEEAHQILSPIFQWEPHYKVQVLIVDNQDQGNGLTSAVGRLGMVLWVTPPSFEYGMTYYDDWLRQLIIHEYTHFLNLDTTSGIYADVRPIFLDLLLPNSFWPPWMLEGLAVYMETRHTHMGRGRSPYYEAILRASVEEKNLNTPQFITLDKINGENPYFPHGDSRYQFGYHLMNEVSLHQDQTLGGLSYESSSKIPTFINRNLMGVVGRDWYQAWDDWVAKTQKRMGEQLKIIQSSPTNTLHWITDRTHESSNEVTGVAFSADGQWMAYTAVSTHKRQGLYLKNRKTEQTEHLSDQRHGATLAFTPDSQAFIYSEINRLDQFSLRSDLRIYSIKSGKIQVLTHGLRAKDPHLSTDGKWVVFTLIDHAVTQLAKAELRYHEDSGEYELGPIIPLYQPTVFHQVAFPKFSTDGKKIYFTEHPNGLPQEDLMELTLSTGQTRTLLANGHYQLFPTIDPSSGGLYFVSDQTGVQNLYQYREGSQPPRLVTNLTTGLQLPSFDHQGKLYASVLSTAGWDLAEIDPLPAGPDLDPKKITVPPPPAPKQKENKPTALTSSTASTPYAQAPYSPWRTLKPRGILPLLSLDAAGLTVGAQTAGFDAIDLHRYDLSATYSSRLKLGDFAAMYANRTLGALLGLSGEYSTSITSSNSSQVLYSRQTRLKASASYLIERTYHYWLPHAALNLERTLDYRWSTTGGAPPSLRVSRPFYLSADLGIQFSNEEVSRLAISGEGGQTSQIAIRYYDLPRLPTFKVFFEASRFFRLKDHLVLRQRSKVLWASRYNLQYPFANALTLGRSSERLIGSFSGDGLGQLSIRGYPGQGFVSQLALSQSLQLNFPLARLFRGWGTQLAFANNLSGFAFIDNAILRTFQSPSTWYLPAVGAGIQLSTEVFFLPFTVSLELHRGLNSRFNPKTDFFIQVISHGFTF